MYLAILLKFAGNKRSVAFDKATHRFPSGNTVFSLRENSVFSEGKEWKTIGPYRQRYWSEQPLYTICRHLTPICHHPQKPLNTNILSVCDSVTTNITKIIF